jgi:hypothetical protein
LRHAVQKGLYTVTNLVLQKEQTCLTVAFDTRVQDAPSSVLCWNIDYYGLTYLWLFSVPPDKSRSYKSCSSRDDETQCVSLRLRGQPWWWRRRQSPKRWYVWITWPGSQPERIYIEIT